MMSRRDWLFALALLVLTFLVYAPAWHGQPIWDDDIHITRPDLRSVQGLARIWVRVRSYWQLWPYAY